MILRPMNSILAIALISIRNAIRSKIVIVLLTFLVITLIGLPLTLKGDGTLAGHARVLLWYTLGLATLILSIATVWASCAALSSEIRDRQIQMIVCKPVRASQIWLGKWLGLTGMNVLFLFLCFASTYAGLRWTTQPERWADEEMTSFDAEILSAQRHLSPRPRDLKAEVERQYQAGRARGEWPAELHASEILPRLERQVRTQANSVPAGHNNRWVFDVPDAASRDRSLVLRYRFSVSVFDMEPIRGAWTIGPPHVLQHHVVDVEAAPRTWHHLTIPAEMIADDGTVTVEFANVHDRPITVIFPPEDGLNLLVYASGFLSNYARAYLLILFHLAFLAAIGITAGAYFSIPVAAMTSFYALLLLQAGRFVRRIAQRDVITTHAHSHGHDHGSGWFEHGLEAVTLVIYKGLHFLIRPLESANPLEYVATGEWISWMEVGHMFFIKVIVYSGIIMMLGAWHLARKEVALPS